jgi:hypothetical protein
MNRDDERPFALFEQAEVCQAAELSLRRIDIEPEEARLAGSVHPSLARNLVQVD